MFKLRVLLRKIRIHQHKTQPVSSFYSYLWLINLICLITFMLRNLVISCLKTTYVEFQRYSNCNKTFSGNANAGISVIENSEANLQSVFNFLCRYFAGHAQGAGQRSLSPSIGVGRWAISLRCWSLRSPVCSSLRHPSLFCARSRGEVGGLR